MTHIGPESRIEIPFMGRWHYSRAEMIADGIVHAVGIALAIAAGSALLALAAFHAGPGEYVAAAFYVVSLLTVLRCRWPTIFGRSRQPSGYCGASIMPRSIC